MLRVIRYVHCYCLSLVVLVCVMLLAPAGAAAVNLPAFASHVPVSSGYQGWGYVTAAGAASSDAWRWTATGWVYEPVAVGTPVYVYPWGTGWNWAWYGSAWHAVSTARLATWSCSQLAASATVTASSATSVRSRNAASSSIAGSLPQGASAQLSCANVFADAGVGFPGSGTVTPVYALVSANAGATTIRGYVDVRALQAASSSTSSSSVSPSGESLPTTAVPGWHQIYTDDFTTPVPLGSFPAAVSGKWGAYPSPWPDTSHNGMYSPEKVVSIGNGMMNVYLHTESGQHLVAAVTPKLPASMTAGRYAIRFRADPVPGYKTAWLLWPDSEVWPRDGEIDFPEGDLNGQISGFMHRQGGTSGSDQDAYSTSATYTSWHTAIVEWTPSRLTFMLDGRVIGTSTSRVPNTPMHWVIQTETALNGIAPANSAAGNVQIDWVAVWAPN